MFRSWASSMTDTAVLYNLAKTSEQGTVCAAPALTEPNRRLDMAKDKPHKLSDKRLMVMYT